MTVNLPADCSWSTVVISHTDAIDGGLKTQEIRATYSAGVKPGDVLAAMDSGRVVVHEPGGTPVATWFTGKSGDETGMTFDRNGVLYVTDFDADSVTKLASDGSLLGTFGTGYADAPESMVFDAAGAAYVGHADGRVIHKRGPDGALLATFSPAFEDRGVDHMALKPDGCTMIYTSEGFKIFQFDVCTNTQLPDFATSSARPMFGVEILPNGNVLVAGRGQIRMYSSQGTQVATWDVPGITNEWFGTALDPDGVHFWVTDMLNNRLYRFNLNQPGGADQMIQTTAAPTEGSPYFGLGDVMVVPASFSSVNREAQAAGEHPDEPTSQEPPVDP